MPLTSGTALGHYRILDKLGTGGMGEVYRAHDTKLGRDVALKVLAVAFANDADMIARFNREARAVAALNHPHIVTIYSVEESDGVHFLTMELIAGEALGSILPSRGLPAADVLDVAWALVDALAAAHDRGIVHRDLKPSNVMITASRRVKVLDFGIAKVLGDPAADSMDETALAIGRTDPGLVVGTVPYMSPEQVEGKPVDHRSDLFSLGVILYEIATGERPFRGDSAAAVISAILRDPPPDLCVRRADLPAALGQLVSRCLEKDRNRRPDSASEIRDAVEVMRRSPTPSAPQSEADRLADEGARRLRFAMAGGSAARTNIEQAEVYLKRALAISPTHSKALCQYVTWHYVMSNLGFAPLAESTAKASEGMLAALTADDQNVETHCALAKVFLYVDDDFPLGRHHVERAAELDPHEPEVLRLRCIIGKLEGQFDTAVSAAQLMASRSPDVPMHWNTLGDVLMAAERFAEAETALRAALARQPGFGAALERMEQVLFCLGRVDESVDFRIARLQATGQSTRADQLSDESATLGGVEARRRDLQREVEVLLAEAATSDPLSPSWLRTIGDRLIVAYCALGDWANAMVWIERWYAKRPGRLRRVLMDLPIDRNGLATQPRYGRLLRMAGLEGL